MKEVSPSLLIGIAFNNPRPRGVRFESVGVKTARCRRRGWIEDVGFVVPRPELPERSSESESRHFLNFELVTESSS